jgi:hypothetical protein
MELKLRKEKQPKHRDVLVTMTVSARVEHRPPREAYVEDVDSEDMRTDMAKDTIYVGTEACVGAIELNGQMVLEANERMLQELTRHAIKQVCKDAPDTLEEMHLGSHIAKAAMGETNTVPLTAKS